MRAVKRNQTNRIRLEQELFKVRSLPQVATKVLELTDNEVATAAEIEKVMRADQALSAKLLQVVNSSFFGLSGNVSSISQAVVLMGFQQVRNLILSVCTLSRYDVSLESTRKLLGSCWRESFTAAAAANVLSRAVNMEVKRQEHAFVIGLMSDIGKLFMITAFEPMYEEVLQKVAREGLTVLEAELEVYGETHPVIGKKLTASWNFPAELVEAVALHEDVNAKANDMLHCARIANQIARAITEANGNLQVVPELTPEDQEWLDANRANLPQLCKDTLEKVTSMTGELGLTA